jgi:hypothetical protein
MNLEQLKQRCGVWQQRMRLQDWSVELVFRSRAEMPSGRSGECKFLLAKKTAIIYLLDPAVADRSWLEYDPELTLVHELTHLHLAPWNIYFSADDQDAELLLEQAVHALSTSLYQGWRNVGSTSININAMDAKSFADHSGRIAAALKQTAL